LFAFQLLPLFAMLAACNAMQQVTYGYQPPQTSYQYQKPFTAFKQPEQLAYQQPAPYQYQQPVYQQVSTST
jgi:hypothetical protein